MSDFWLWLHVVAAGIWLGGLVLLAVVAVVGLRRLERDAFRRLLAGVGRSFGVLSGLVWLLLAISGFALARARVASFADLPRTPAGRLVETKVSLSVLVIAAAAVHTVLGRRTESRSAIIVSRALAILIFAATLVLYYLGVRLGSY